jgi:hypothetical protein
MIDLARNRKDIKVGLLVALIILFSQAIGKSVEFTLTEATTSSQAEACGLFIAIIIVFIFLVILWKAKK